MQLVKITDKRAIFTTKNIIIAVQIEPSAKEILNYYKKIAINDI